MNKIVILLLPFVLCACDYGVLWTDDPYEVHWVDTGSNVTLARRINGGPDTIGRVSAEVIAVGSNEKDVVAKQRGHDSENIFYFHVEKSKDSTYLNLDVITQGPFSKKMYL